MFITRPAVLVKIWGKGISNIMVYEKEITGRFVTLKSITVKDADFSYELRKDPRFVDIMGQPAESPQAQREFIRWQRKQPGDYYFVVFNKAGERIGLTGVYNIHGDTGEMGRELNIGAPYETMEAEVLVYEFARYVLHLKYVISVVYKNNIKQINMLKRRGEKLESETVRNGVAAYQGINTIEAHGQNLEKTRRLLERVSLRN